MTIQRTMHKQGSYKTIICGTFVSSAIVINSVRSEQGQSHTVATQNMYVYI